MPDVKLPTAEELERAGRVWAQLRRPEAEGLLVMTEWHPCTAGGREALRDAALLRWDQLGHHLQCALFTAIKNMAIVIRATQV